MAALNRRQFIQALGLVLLSTQIPICQKEYPDFNPNCQYGDFVYVSEKIDSGLLKDIQEGFDAQISENIPPSYRKKIKWFVNEPGAGIFYPFQQYGSVGWKYTG